MSFPQLSFSNFVFFARDLRARVADARDASSQGCVRTRSREAKRTQGGSYDASVGEEEEEVDEEEREEAKENEDEEEEDEGREEEGREEDEEDEDEEDEEDEDEDVYGCTITKHGICDAAAGSNECSPCFS